jgi:chemotaxis protein methyltransferase CheR
MLLEKTEAEALIETIMSAYGYDFSGYARASLYRRINRFLQNKQVRSIPELREKILGDPGYFEVFLQEITVNVTEMFRDPSFFFALRKKVLPILSTYPYIKIWDAGCSTGEELYSLAIMLKEENLLHKTRIYATDVNQKVLAQAKEGIYPIGTMKEYTQSYHQSGGQQDFSEYYTARYGYAKFNQSLIENVIFYPHNLATDGSFNEFHLIVCRNVLIYFNKDLQDKVLHLFMNSLAGLGYLGLGKKESMTLLTVENQFKVVDKAEKIFRKLN